jgi:serine/threonine protein phosphatase PrpC
MGAFLEKPKTEKITVKGEGCGIKYGVSAMQGWRMEMEDAHVCETNFKLKEHSFFGVFDGHAGPKVSQYCSVHLLDTILECLGEDKKEDKVSKAIHDGFLKLDENLKKQPQWASGEDRSGTTAIVAMVTPKKIIWGNCGDSRGLLCRKGKVFFSTQDHKPYNQSERARIEKAGGTVMMQRVNGSLAVSRALGDFDYKREHNLKATEQLVSPEPEITMQERDPDSDEFLLLACDGIFDVMSNDEVVAYVSHHLKLTNDLVKICSDLIDTCLNKVLSLPYKINVCL